MPAEGLPVRRRRQPGQGYRRLRDLELRPWREADAVELPRLEVVQSLPRIADRDRSARSFNLFNAENPSTFITTRLLGTGAPNPDFLQPTEYSGDFQNPEQRVGQFGFRFSF